MEPVFHMKELCNDIDETFLLLFSTGRGHSQVTVFAVHVVGTGTGVVSQPDAKVLDFQGLLLRDFFNADNLAGGLQVGVLLLSCN